MQSFKQVSSGLADIAALLRFAGEPKFKVKAYERGAEVVDTLGDDLAGLIEQDRLRELEGIGPALARQIQELWNTGASSLLSRLRAETPEGAGELVQVAGMTPRRMRALHEALAIRSVEELHAACAAGRVRGVPGFGKKTEERLLAGSELWLKRGEATPRPSLLAHALELASLLERELRKSVAEAQLTGALRRAQETVTEIEFVVRGDAVAALRRLSGLRQVLRVDIDTCKAYLSGGLLLKLHAAERHFGSTLVATTGAEAHVAQLEERARSAGVHLGLQEAVSAAPPTIFETEHELYAALGLAWVPPELRHGTDELAQAERGGFADLIELSDIQGLVHCHTSYSDGKASVLEMASAAHALGMKYITITDHSPSAYYAGGVTLERLKQQWDDIAAAQELVPIRILRGTESDILADGTLDYPDAILEQFDVIIASIHARHRMDRAAMTERLKRALGLPVFKIWGHALGRIINHRDPIDCDVEAVLDVLAGARGAIEINADPHRLDLPPAWIPAARARHIPFVISVDAHSTRGFGVMKYGIDMARRGGLRKREVLNALPAASFGELVRPA